MKVTKFKIVSHFWLLARTQSTNLAIFFPKKTNCRNLATTKPIYICSYFGFVLSQALAEFSPKKKRKAA
jgi:hypothetical protein